MQMIELDAEGWADVLDFYKALKVVLGSPRWHGNSLNAWQDSIVYGSINTVEGPYHIRITNVAKCSDQLRHDIQEFAEAIEEARGWRLGSERFDIGVTTEIVE